MVGIVSAIPSICVRCSWAHRYYFVSINVTLLAGGAVPLIFDFFSFEGWHGRLASRGRFSRIQFQFLRLPKVVPVSLHTFFFLLSSLDNIILGRCIVINSPGTSPCTDSKNIITIRQSIILESIPQTYCHSI